MGLVKNKKGTTNLSWPLKSWPRTPQTWLVSFPLTPNSQSESHDQGWHQREGKWCPSIQGTICRQLQATSDGGTYSIPQVPHGVLFFIRRWGFCPIPSKHTVNNLLFVIDMSFVLEVQAAGESCKYLPNFPETADLCGKSNKQPMTLSNVLDSPQKKTTRATPN